MNKWDKFNLFLDVKFEWREFIIRISLPTLEMSDDGRQHVGCRLFLGFACNVFPLLSSGLTSDQCCALLQVTRLYINVRLLFLLQEWIKTERTKERN